MGKKILWGLIGCKSIGEYSIAPQMWKDLFKTKNIDVEYFVLGTDNLSKITVSLKKYLGNESFLGCNIAFPWKHLGYGFCDHVENSVNKVETVNTIIKKGKDIEGYNTDGIGIVKALETITKLKGMTIFIAGSGSSTQTIPFHLMNRKVKKIYLYDILNFRSKGLARKYSDVSKAKNISILSIGVGEILKILPEIDILINTTPCGMKGFGEDFPFDKSYLKVLNKKCICAEAVYTPYETPLLKYIKKRGNKICPGVKMLVEQAAESFYHAFGERLSKNDKILMENAAKGALKEK